MFVAKNEEMVPVAKTRAFMHPRHPDKDITAIDTTTPMITSPFVAN
jgi:hypothetical protein